MKKLLLILLCLPIIGFCTVGIVADDNDVITFNVDNCVGIEKLTTKKNFYAEQTYQVEKQQALRMKFSFTSMMMIQLRKK